MTEASALNKNPIRSAAFRVLRAPDFPSILIELGYMSSPTDIGLLTSETWVNKAADSLAASILDFLSAQKRLPVSAIDPADPAAH
jgi:N-acetylmuramoyl-L-alanine amidase